jgi:hypothetical protein
LHFFTAGSRASLGRSRASAALSRWVTTWLMEWSSKTRTRMDWAYVMVTSGGTLTVADDSGSHPIAAAGTVAADERARFS